MLRERKKKTFLEAALGYPHYIYWVIRVDSEAESLGGCQVESDWEDESVLGASATDLALLPVFGSRCGQSTQKAVS